jgi:UDP-N-acetylglucosamine 2-epimerase
MIQVLAGTRPEVLKLAPVVVALRARGAEVELVGVEQQPELVRATLAEVGLEADRWRPMVSGTLERRFRPYVDVGMELGVAQSTR